MTSLQPPYKTNTKKFLVPTKRKKVPVFPYQGPKRFPTHTYTLITPDLITEKK